VPETIVLLHGFAGTRRAFDGVGARLSAERYLPLALDLPGHGETGDHPRPITFAACVSHVLARSPERFALCGYSMGGRVALHVALTAPARVSRLVLVSASPGIEDARERARRRASDELLADQIEGSSIEAFITRWDALELFARDPPEVDRVAREDQRRNSPDALAAVLRGIGTGAMEPLWRRLQELTMPVRMLAGERDGRFQALAERAVAMLPDGDLAILAGGHRLLLENPAGVARALEAH
jgi:2-succinyl-6-hydroxy-2,4-cyclohexadiene-1-carboxylate synthase